MDVSVSSSLFCDGLSSYKNLSSEPNCFRIKEETKFAFEELFHNIAELLLEAKNLNIIIQKYKTNLRELQKNYLIMAFTRVNFKPCIMILVYVRLFFMLLETVKK